MPLGLCIESAERSTRQMWLTDGVRGGNPDRVAERGSRNGVSADVSFAHHGVLFIGEITRREARRSQSSVSD
jgi:hypothetical protein